jgi:hypothetical protein
MQEYEIPPSQQSIERASFQPNERDRALVAAREEVRQRYGIAPEIAVIPCPWLCFKEERLGKVKDSFFVSIYSCDRGDKTELHLLLLCDGRTNLDGSCPTIASLKNHPRFPLLPDLNTTVLLLRRGVTQMIEATAPITPGEPMPIHLLCRDPHGFLIYNPLHKILLVQNMASDQQTDPQSEWKIFRETDSKMSFWRGSSGPLRAKNTLTATFTGQSDAAAAELEISALGGWVCGTSVMLQLGGKWERGLKHFTDYHDGYNCVPAASYLLTTELAVRWPYLKIPSEPS